MAIQVLFLCTHNSARSILAEALLNHLGAGRFKAYSAGSAPRDGGSPNALGLQVLCEHGIATASLRSKSWDEFALANAPKIDLVITVCDSAAGEACPLFYAAPQTSRHAQGNPASAHWGYPDPSAGRGTDAQKLEAFRETFQAMRRRLLALVNLPDAQLQKQRLQQSARELVSV